MDRAGPLVAEIRGRTLPGERIVMVAHVQEPGASDNASGCATLYALARALNESIASGALPPPERTLTFIWGDEVNASREWIRAHPDAAAGVRYMFALDMTGEDTAQDRRHVPDRETGGPVRRLVAALGSAQRMGQFDGRRRPL